jgi:hypothetical protein
MIANFETSDEFEDRLVVLNEIVQSIQRNHDIANYNETYETWLSEIDYHVIPKTFESKNSSKCINENTIVNSFDRVDYQLEKLNFLFKGPIELHLITFYWILKYGTIIEQAYSPYNYANKLQHQYSNIADKSNKTFKPYFKSYSEWRDNGILKAKGCHSNNEGSAILMLDISSFYYSVDFDFEDLDSFFEERLSTDEYSEYKALTEIIYEIIEEYNLCIIDECKLVDEDQMSLPLGLPISPIFANFYLREFDDSVISKVQPLYYGRYVDDIMIVLSEKSYEKIEYSSEFTKNFIKSNFIENFNILYEKDNEYFVNSENYIVDYFDRIKIQADKIKLYILKREGTDALIEKFVENIRKNSSEFRYLPEESKVISEFYTDAYSMLYNDTHNKLRSIEKFEGNKYGVSKYLAKIIMTSKFWNDDKDKLNLLIDQVDNFFTGIHCFQYYTLWEKIFTFYVVNNRPEKIQEFYDRIQENLKHIKATNHGRSNSNKLRKFLRDYSKLSLTLACSLNFNLIDSLKITNFNIKSEALKIRQTNMFRHDHLITPLLNYTMGSEKYGNLLTLNIRCSKDKIESNECHNCKDCDLKFDENKFRFSPRFIHYHEVLSYNSYIEAYRWSEGYYGNYIKKSKKDYCNANKLDLTMVNNCLPEVKSNNENLLINTIELPKESKVDKLRIGVTSIWVDCTNIEKSYLKNPNLSRKRFNALIKLINYIEKTNSDIIVLPEVSIPFAWISVLTKYAQKQQRTLIFGVEHIINRNNYAMNLLATIVPFRVNDLNYSFTRLRLKNHYSPEESRLLEGYRYKLPFNPEMSYDIFKWRGVRFSCFNCFELADIQHRSVFRNKVDFLTASEYNKDTNYFSNIVESVTRDVHCYFVQSNSSNFGDSRISKPSQTATRDIVKLKGGINDQVVVGEIDISALRKFQYKEYELQKDDKTFKPTPPNFDKREIEKILSE